MAPNPIDLSAVLAGFSNIADNLSVLMMLCGLVGFYIILIILCRRADKRDRRKVSYHKLTMSYAQISRDVNAISTRCG